MSIENASGPPTDQAPTALVSCHRLRFGPALMAGPENYPACLSGSSALAHVSGKLARLPPGHRRPGLAARPITGSNGPAIEDVDLKLADGTRIHAWWAPRPDSENVALYLHGNAGNLSHRGPSMLKMRELLKMSVLQPDYPGTAKATAPRAKRAAAPRRTPRTIGW